VLNRHRSHTRPAAIAVQETGASISLILNRQQQA
jgi:hypothetical protein